MASDKTPDLLELFATSARNRPQRTYSHKGKGSPAVSLPALKPAPDTSTPYNNGVRLQTFYIRNTRSREAKIVREGPAQQLPSLRDQRIDAHDDGSVRHVRDDNEHDATDEPEAAGESNDHSAVDPEEVTSPLSPSSQLPSSPDSEESEVPEAEEDDEDDIIILSQRPLGSTPKHDRRTGNRTRSLRRRPFLIFDKTEAKGYKQLKNKPQPAKTSPVSRYRPGDGFSSREARPNGSNLLTRAGKLSITGPHVGILDLTQSDPAPVKQKRGIRRATLDDNSFISAPKKKPRRPLHAKDPNQQPKPATTAPAVALVKKSSSVLGAAEKVRLQSSAQGPEAGQTGEKPTQDAATGDNSSHPETTRQIPPDNDDDNEVDMLIVERSDDNEVDMLIIERSDDIHENPDTTSNSHGIALEEGQDSCVTHVTDSPQHQLRIRAGSVSPETPPCRSLDVTDGPPLAPRLFRRFNTQ